MDPGPVGQVFLGESRPLPPDLDRVPEPLPDGSWASHARQDRDSHLPAPVTSHPDVGHQPGGRALKQPHSRLVLRPEGRPRDHADAVRSSVPGCGITANANGLPAYLKAKDKDELAPGLLVPKRTFDRE